MATRTHTTTTITCGRLMSAQMRHFLNEYALDQVTYREEHNLVTSFFTIYGPSDCLREITRAVHRIERVTFLVLVTRGEKRHMRKHAKAHNVELVFEKNKGSKYRIARLSGPRHRVRTCELAWENRER